MHTKLGPSFILILCFAALFWSCPVLREARYGQWRAAIRTTSIDTWYQTNYHRWTGRYTKKVAMVFTAKFTHCLCEYFFRTKSSTALLSPAHISLFPYTNFPFFCDRIWPKSKIILCTIDPSTTAIGLSCVPWHLQEETMLLPRWGLKLLNRTKRSSSKRSPTSMVSPIFLLGSIEVSRVLSCLFFFFEESHAVQRAEGKSYVCPLAKYYHFH